MDVSLEVQESVDEQLPSLDRESHELIVEPKAMETYISKLPNELLLEIFMIITATSSSISDWYKRVNLVCRHWRVVAIGAPILWNTPHTREHNLTLLMLERSAHSDLNIYLDFETESRTTLAILKHMERIRLLDIHQSQTALEETQGILLGLAQEGSRLRFLIISCHTNTDPHPGSKVKLSPNVLLGLNQLHYLRLSGIVFDWKALPFQNLRHLCLDNTSLMTPILYEQLIDTLRQMLQLEAIFLPLPTMLSQHRPPSHVKQLAYLPRLYDLALHYTLPDHLHCFLSHTELPCLRYAHIACDNTTNYAVGDYLTTVQAIFALLRSGGFGEQFQSMEIHHGRFRVSFFKPTPGSKYARSQPVFDIRIPNFGGGDEDDDDDDDVLIKNLQFMSRISLGIIDMTRNNLSLNLTHAEIGRTQDSLEVLRFLGELPGLKNIAIHNRLVAPLTAALTIGLDVPPSQTLPFPKLDSIIWRNVHYRDQIGIPELEQFRECLMMRHEYGLSIYEMLLFHCTVSQWEVDLLKHIVPKVTCKILWVIIGD